MKLIFLYMYVKKKNFWKDLQFAVVPKLTMAS